MTRFVTTAAALALFSCAALADTQGLNFDPAKLCEWQKANNNMDSTECLKLENEAKAAMAELEAKADQKRRDDCATEAKNFSGDSGFASFTVYTECLKNGPGNN